MVTSAALPEQDFLQLKQLGKHLRPSTAMSQSPAPILPSLTDRFAPIAAQAEMEESQQPLAATPSPVPAPTPTGG